MSVRKVWCPDCHRYEVRQAVKVTLPTWRDELRMAAKLIVGTAFVYAFAVVYFAGAVR